MASNQQSNSVQNVLDVLVLGAGPAGLSAGLALGRVLRSVAIFDSGEYRNASSSHAHTVPLHDHQNPADIRRGMKEEILAKYKTVSFTISTAVSILDLNGIFEITDENKRRWIGRKVILASGSCDVFPDIPGYQEAWGKGILHCPFCRGFEETEAGLANAAFLVTKDASSSEIEHLVFYKKIVSQFTQDTILLLNGNSKSPPHSKLAAIALASGMRVIEKPIKKLIYGGEGATMEVEFVDASKETFGMIFHNPKTHNRGDFGEQLGLKLTLSGEFEVTTPMQETSRRGIFAAGDCATPMKQVAIAMGLGVSSGIGANYQIVMDDLEKELCW